MLTGFYDLSHLRSGISFEDRGAGDEDLGACFDHEGGGVGGDAAVDFYGDLGHLFESSYLIHHLGDEVLASEAGVDAHHVYVVDERQGPLDQFGWARRVQGDAGLAAAGPDHSEGAMKVRDDLGLDGDACHPGFDERGDQIVRVGNLQVGVDGEVYGRGERGRDRGANGQVGHEVVVHHVEVDEIGASPLRPPHLLREVREIGR